jgi:hypothetical protein
VTDRHAGYLVVLEEDVREDAAQPILDSLWMVKGVLKVTPVIGGDSRVLLAEVRAQTEITNRVIAALRGPDERA